MYGPVLVCLPGVAELPGTAVSLLVWLLLLLLSALWQRPGQHAAAQLLATCPVAHISIDKAAEQHIRIALHCGACAYIPAMLWCVCIHTCYLVRDVGPVAETAAAPDSSVSGM